MRKVILPVSIALVLLIAGCSTGTTGSGVAVARTGELAPDFQLKNLDGQNISLSDFRGKPVALNFWATWCGWCRVEMPYLQQVLEEWSDEGLVLLTIDVGESASKVRQFMQNNNFSLPVLLDTRQVVAQKYNITSYPSTFFINKDGIIQEKKIGAFLDKEQIEHYLNQIIP